MRMSSEYWKRARGQYLDCLGEHGKEGNNCDWCTKETQSDCIEYARFVKEESEV